jgi:predicted  nucleic acid-binding Zn-ribbon protein
MRTPDPNLKESIERFERTPPMVLIKELIEQATAEKQTAEKRVQTAVQQLASIRAAIRAYEETLKAMQERSAPRREAGR